MTEETKMILEQLKKLNDKVTDIQLTLENETNKNIKIIAEGHLDLSRKLDEALKVDSEKEMLMIRVNRLENELRRLKARVEEIAQLRRKAAQKWAVFLCQDDRILYHNSMSQFYIIIIIHNSISYCVYKNSML